MEAVKAPWDNKGIFFVSNSIVNNEAFLTDDQNM